MVNSLSKVWELDLRIVVGDLYGSFLRNEEYEDESEDKSGDERSDDYDGTKWGMGI